MTTSKPCFWSSSDPPPSPVIFWIPHHPSSFDKIWDFKKMLLANDKKRYLFLKITIKGTFLKKYFQLPELLNPEKVHNTNFYHRNGQNWTPKTAKMNKFTIENFDFWSHISTFWPENTRKIEILIRLLNLRSTEGLFDHQNGQIMVSTWQKMSIFGSIFDLRALKIASLTQTIFKNSFPI